MLALGAHAREREKHRAVAGHRSQGGWHRIGLLYPVPASPSRWPRHRGTHGPFIGIGPAQLDRAERQPQASRRDCGGARRAVTRPARPDGNRLRDLSRSVPCVPAGVGLGSLIYIVGYTMLGYFAGPAVLGLFEALHLPIGLLGFGGPRVLLLGGLPAAQLRRPRSVRREVAAEHRFGSGYPSADVRAYALQVQAAESTKPALIVVKRGSCNCRRL
jgi:hypothetical protein